MTAPTGDDPTRKGRRASNSSKQSPESSQQPELEQPANEAESEPEPQLTEMAAEVEHPPMDSPALSRSPGLAESPIRRRSLFAQWLEDQLDWLEDWLLHHKGFSEEETQVIIQQLQAHHRQMETEQWQLRDFFLVEIHEKGEGDAKQWRTVAFSGDQDSPHCWDDMASVQLAAWLLNKLETTWPTDSEPGATEGEFSSAKLTILRAQIQQSSQPELTIETQAANSTFSTPITRHEPFDVHIQFKIDGLSAVRLAKHPLTCEILYDVRDRTTKQKVLMSDEKRPFTRLVELRDVYTATIKGLRLPPGTYQLRLVITDHAHLLGGISPVLQVT